VALPTRAEVFDALKAVIDPELGINIVDLGLIYDVVVENGVITVRYTLTTLACGLGPVIESSIVEVLLDYPADDIRTELSFDPPWTPEMISPEAKAMLGLTEEYLQERTPWRPD
jgi:metal-sulfur cluster biosynthetic enzyme